MDLLSVKYLKESKIGDYCTFPKLDDTDKIEKSNVMRSLKNQILTTESTTNSLN